MITALVFPYFSGSIDKASEKQKVVQIITAVSTLRKNAISFMAVAAIESYGYDLVFYLDNEETERITLPEPPLIDGTIYFNRYGIASGGEIIIKFNKTYRLVIEEVSGKISLD